ncbi:hypothetical protein HanRHA438_Chr14g0671021 [Helianthus annuus]|nr:hypothetical protein HanRHA438_Chr14g0671021 [Helianthus annuus]
MKHCRATIWHPRAGPIYGNRFQRFERLFEKHDRAVAWHGRATLTIWANLCRFDDFLKITIVRRYSTLVPDGTQPRKIAQITPETPIFSTFCLGVL